MSAIAMLPNKLGARMMARTIGFAILTLILLAPASAAERPPQKLELRLVAQQAGAETEKIEYQHSRNSKEERETLYLQKGSLLPEYPLKTVSTSIDNGQPSLSLTFTTEGTKKLAEVTRAHKFQRLAFLVGGRVISAASIQEEITGGELKLTGSFTEQEAAAMAEALQAGINTK
jgi:preprotein translocase subunit SecD